MTASRLCDPVSAAITVQTRAHTQYGKPPPDFPGPRWRRRIVQRAEAGLVRRLHGQRLGSNAALPIRHLQRPSIRTSLVSPRPTLPIRNHGYAHRLMTDEKAVRTTCSPVRTALSWARRSTFFRTLFMSSRTSTRMGASRCLATTTSHKIGMVSAPECGEGPTEAWQARPQSYAGRAASQLFRHGLCALASVFR